MKIVLQRVSHASVTVDEKVIGAIGQGFLVLLGVSDTDTEEIADKWWISFASSGSFRMIRERRTFLWQMWGESFWW